MAAALVWSVAALVVGAMVVASAGGRPASGEVGAAAEVAQSDDEIRLDLVGRLGGQSLAVVGIGHHALLAEGSQVLAIDVSRPSAPRLEWRSGHLGADVRRMAVVGSRALVLTDRLSVVELGGPAAPGSAEAPPRLFGPFDGFGGRELAVEEDRAYLLDGRRVSIVDTAAPASPRLVGSVAVDRSAYGIAVDGRVLWIGDDGGLRSFDVRDPAVPRSMGLLGEEIGLQQVSCLAAGGGRVALAGHADQADRIVVLDAKDPAAPRLLGGRTLVGRNPTYGCRLLGGRFHVAKGPIGAVEYDVSGKGDPAVVAVRRPGDHVTDAYPLGTLVLLSTVGAGESTQSPTAAPGLRIYDASGVRAGSYSTIGGFGDVAVAGGLAYVTDDSGALRVLDVSDPSDPLGLGSVATAGAATHLVVDRGIALVATRPNSVAIYDVEDPGAPRRLGAVRIGQPETALAARGGLAIVPDGPSMVLIDYSVPSAPQEIGRLEMDDDLGGVAMGEGVAFVACAWHVMHVVDLSQPRRPRVVGSVGQQEDRGWGSVVAWDGTHALVGQRMPGWHYVPTPEPPTPGPSPTGPTPFTPVATVPPDGAQMVVVDVSTPSAPRPRGRTGPMREPPVRAMGVAAGRAWLLSGGDSLVAVGYTDPDSLAVRHLAVDTGITTGVDFRHVAVDGPHVYVASSGGLLVYRVSRPGDPRPTRPPTRTPSATPIRSATPTPTRSPTPSATSRPTFRACMPFGLRGSP